jgi:hypothetical protein
MTRRSLAAALVALALLPGAAAAHSGSKARALARDAAGAERALERVERLRAGRGVRTGHELTHALRELALRLPALRGTERRQAEAYLARPTDGGADPFGDGYSTPSTYHDTQNFRIHYVTSTADAPPPADTSPANGVPDYVEAMGTEFETTRAVENSGLAWPPPVPDGSLGGDSRTDVYIKQLGGQGLFGYTATDPDQPSARRFAFLVMDDDYVQSEFPRYANYLDPLRVTAAHEYNHVLHYGIDSQQDPWMFESGAVWMEDQVYDGIDDYLSYLPAPRWAGAAMTRLPLTYFNPGNPLDPQNVKVYGDAVFTHWLAERWGPEIVRDAWTASLGAGSFGPGAYQAALGVRGGSFFDEFVGFSAAVPEWRVPPASQPGGRGFSEGASYPDVERLGVLSAGAPSTQLTADHTTFSLFDVQPAGAPSVTFAGSLPPGTAGAVALVGRTGDPTSGAVTASVQPLPAGGRGAVTLGGAAGFARITAVLVNADVANGGFDSARRDWAWTKDGQCATASIAGNATPPALRLESPATGASLTGAASATFSEPVYCLGAASVQLLDPAGNAVPAAVTYDGGARRVTVDPAPDLLDSTRYRIVAGPEVVDAEGNAVAGEAPSFETVRRRPIFLLSGPGAQNARDVARRGLRVTLRSSDRDPLTYSVTVDASKRDLGASAARVVGRRRGKVGPRRTVRFRIRLSAPALRALRAGRRLRLRLRAQVRDPQANVARRTRTVTVRP